MFSSNTSKIMVLSATKLNEDDPSNFFSILHYRINLRYSLVYFIISHCLQSAQAMVLKKNFDLIEGKNTKEEKYSGIIK